MSTTSPESREARVRCEACGSPADAHQRYCLNCGAHLTDVADPVAAYFSEASAARARVAAAVARGALVKRSRRIPRVSAATAVVFVVVALLVGVAIGHSSSSGSGGSSTAAKVTTTAKSATGTSSTKNSSAGTATGKKYRQDENNLPTSVTP
jgi:hypothetical protein